MLLQLLDLPILFLNLAYTAGEISEPYGHTMKSIVMPTARVVSSITPNNIMLCFVIVYLY